ncbi:uncharacterized protein LOC144471735 [Augochlora pura]
MINLATKTKHSRELDPRKEPRNCPPSSFTGCSFFFLTLGPKKRDRPSSPGFQFYFVRGLSQSPLVASRRSGYHPRHDMRRPPAGCCSHFLGFPWTLNTLDDQRPLRRRELRKIWPKFVPLNNLFANEWNPEEETLGPVENIERNNWRNLSLEKESTDTRVSRIDKLVPRREQASNHNALNSTATETPCKSVGRRKLRRQDGEDAKTLGESIETLIFKKKLREHRESLEGLFPTLRRPIPTSPFTVRVLRLVRTASGDQDFQGIRSAFGINGGNWNSDDSDCNEVDGSDATRTRQADRSALPVRSPVSPGIVETNRPSRFSEMIGRQRIVRSPLRSAPLSTADSQWLRYFASETRR